MAGFDPDKYLAAKAVPQAGGFDPDAYLKQKTPGLLDTQLPLGMTPRGLIQGTLDALPAAGMVAGGAAGGIAGIPAAGPLGGAAGGVVGAGIGRGAGETLKNLGEQYILGQDKTRAEVYGNPAQGVVDGMMYEAGGQTLNAGARALAGSQAVKTLSPYIAKAKDVGEKIVTNPTMRLLLSAAESQHGGPMGVLATAVGTDPHTLKYAGQVGKGAVKLMSQYPSAQGYAAGKAVEAARQFSPWDQAK
jgi:hypothetical protein